MKLIFQKCRPDLMLRWVIGEEVLIEPFYILKLQNMFYYLKKILPSIIIFLHFGGIKMSIKI